MTLSDLASWMEEFARPGSIWIAKRLSANDTNATGGHQAGTYFPKELAFRVLPELNRPDTENPKVEFDLSVDSHPDVRRVTATWYNKRLHGTGTRNETRLTNFGGSSSALLAPDSTGSLTVFAFASPPFGLAPRCHVWVCDSPPEEDALEERLGPVDPKTFVLWEPGLARQADLFTSQKGAKSCHLSPDEIPTEWLVRFPTGEEIIRRTLTLRPLAGLPPDDRLLKRRNCEYELFRSVEEAVHLPSIVSGFTSVDGFLALAQTILQSRKSRAGNSLELHVREIFLEDELVSDIDFSHRPVVDGGKRPDFLFPSRAAYSDPGFPGARLRMLAAKTTCKDRWRQVINEADRIAIKHLLTLQEGVSEGQFREMQEAGVQLVVPVGLHDAYPASIRPHLQTLESFIGDVRLLGEA